MQNQGQFWRQVREQRAKLAAALEKGELPGQPTYVESNRLQDEFNPSIVTNNNAIYITSLRHNDRGTRPGFTVMTTVHLAGQRLTEQTHAVATEEEIRRYQGAQLATREEILRRSADRAVKTFAETLTNQAMANQQAEPAAVETAGRKKQ